MRLGMVQLGMPPGVRRVLMRKEVLTSANCKLEARGSARHSQFNLYAQTALEQESINKLL